MRMFDTKLGKWVDICPEGVIIDNEERFLDGDPVHQVMQPILKPLPSNEKDRKRYLLKLAGIQDG